jgi:uncharacterized protein YpmB
VSESSKYGRAVTVWLPNDELERIEAMANETGLSKSKLVARVVKKWLESGAANLVKVEGL